MSRWPVRLRPRLQRRRKRRPSTMCRRRLAPRRAKLGPLRRFLGRLPRLPVQPTSQHRRAHTSVRRAAVPAAPASPPVPKADDTPVQVRFTRFVAAMRSGQTSDAERELSALKAVLPADALGLQRAQAWFDLRTGNEARAAKAYRGILERLPGDAEAAINLASIQAQEADQDGARATLDAAARLNPDSAALRAALAQYTPNVRQ